MDALLSVLFVISIGCMWYGNKQWRGTDESIESGEKFHLALKVGFGLFVLLVINAFTGFSVIPTGLLD